MPYAHKKFLVAKTIVQILMYMSMITYVSVYIYTVPLNYNFILTRVSTSGATKYFVCQMPKFPMEICISTRRDETWHSDVVFTRDVAHGILHAAES